MDTNDYVELDFSLRTPEERTEKTKQILSSISPEKITSRLLERLTDYIIESADKEERKQKKILTDNRMVTVNKRERSFEGLVGNLENGEDGLYSMIAEDKNIIFRPKIQITEEDIEEIPGLKELRKEIELVEEQCKTARGKKAYMLKKQLIEMRQDQYVIKNTYVKPFKNNNIIKTLLTTNLNDRIVIDREGNPLNFGQISLFNPEHISLLLCNYSKLKEDSWDRISDDMKWEIMDLEELVDLTLKEKYPMYYDLLIYKIDGLTNNEIQEILFNKYNIKHSVEYISSLWRNKIPKMIADTAEKKYLEWHFTNKEKGLWKKCGRCGKIKLANNHFFSKNKTSKDGFYSICKDCRNKKG